MSFNSGGPRQTSAAEFKVPLAPQEKPGMTSSDDETKVGWQIPVLGPDGTMMGTSYSS